MKTTIICIETVCGRIAPAGFGSPRDRRCLEQAREATDATLLGAASLRAGDPEFRVTGGRLPEDRIRAVITASGRLPVERSMFSFGPRPWIFAPAALEASLHTMFRARAHVIGVDEISPGRLSLSSVMETLERHGVKSCLIEGGGRLNFEALRQAVVDELMVTIAPKLIGSSSEASLLSGPCALGTPFLDLELVSCSPDMDTGEIFLRYRVVKEEG